MTARTSSARKAAQAKPAAKKTAAPARRAPAKRAPAKKTTSKKPVLSLVKATPGLPTRPRPWMTDIQGYATLAARIAGINTERIQDWNDHGDGTATRHLGDGSTLHYTQNTRTLTWQAICPMGAVHQYPLTNPSTNLAARLHADRCTTPHGDMSLIQPLTADELAEWGILQAPTWAKRLPGEPVTKTKVVPLPQKERALGDQLARTRADTTDTVPMSQAEIAAGLEARTAAAETQPIPTLPAETAKEHPEP